jgi:hypothetical protein
MKKFLTLYVVSLVATVVGLSSARAATIAHWTFEEGTIGSPATTVIDSVGGNNGVAINGPVYVSGAVSNFGTTGLSFNGTNQTVFVDSTSGGDLELTGDFTIEVGVITNSVISGSLPIFMGDSQPSKDPYYIVLNADGSVIFHLYTGGASFDLSTAAGVVSPSASHNIATVFDFDDINGTDNFMRIFVDQTEVASTNIGANVPYYGDTDSDLWIGSVENQFAFFNGTLTDIRISNVALTGDQMFQVPEPGTLAVFGLGLLGLGLSRRRTA